MVHKKTVFISTLKSGDVFCYLNVWYTFNFVCGNKAVCTDTRGHSDHFFLTTKVEIFTQ